VDLSEYEASEKVPANERVKIHMAYFTKENFVGRFIRGYKAKKCLLTKPAAVDLLKAQEKLLKQGFSLIMFDCYRPQKAVNEFVAWCYDESDTRTKKDYYPDIENKRDLLNGYIASRSGHSRGSTLDLGLVHAETGKLVDMGSRFDFFGEISHTRSPLITAKQKANRERLLNAFEGTGFKNYSMEWWHFSLRDEPFKDTYFDFDVE